MIIGGDDGENGAFLVTDLPRTCSEALICDKVSFFFNRKILFVVFSCISAWILLSAVVDE